MITKLKIWDFDGTLFHSPIDSPANKKLYEKFAGLPWNISTAQASQLSKQLRRPIHPRRGWWGRPETLQPPLVPDPVPDTMWNQPILAALIESMAENWSLNVILTGRHTGLRQQVLRILHSRLPQAAKVETKGPDRYEWHDDPSLHLHLLGEQGPCPDQVGPKPPATFPWKIWIIHQYRLIFPQLELTEVWEDRESHCQMFQNENTLVHRVY